ncbi:hypothetical protein [Gracilibacillus alcaliphilus]|uniref:hypothetical protein n=1 Tax=Gracilibacillus alcaliphilus TaxID=1401441 RepID=UPI001956DD9E|nr:hypothetical protein [Gracilibacillus alcaliphilus]MBM7678392.1 C4-type Zn-finger protein [Gracilibacillus alcaliphilus]
MNQLETTMCNNCGHVFNIVFKEKSHPNNIKETYIECDRCYFHYTSFVTDSRVRKLQKKKDQLKGAIHIERRLELQDQINARMARLKDNLIRFGRADL